MSKLFGAVPFLGSVGIVTTEILRHSGIPKKVTPPKGRSSLDFARPPTLLFSALISPTQPPWKSNSTERFDFSMKVAIEGILPRTPSEDDGFKR